MNNVSLAYVEENKNILAMEKQANKFIEGMSKN